MEKIKQAMTYLNQSINNRDKSATISFGEFLEILLIDPHNAIRNVFQVFHDMVKTYIGEGINEYQDDPECIDFVHFDCTRLFVDGTDHPFFADRLFANRLNKLAEALRQGAQQNKIYIFDGPPGCGKSTFLNNLLLRFEEYANTERGSRFETIWRLDRKALGAGKEMEAVPLFERLSELLNGAAQGQTGFSGPKACGRSDQETNEFYEDQMASYMTEDYLEIPCPSHDHPLLLIPKAYRRNFFEALFGEDAFKERLFNEKEYEWVFKENPCTICASIFDALIKKTGSSVGAFKMLYARPYRFNRRLGQGITVFNPGDRPNRQNITGNAILQRRLNAILQGGNQVPYLHSRFANTNNGIYALMDIKSHNTDRLSRLHNIISEGVHKVEDIEESVNSLFLAVMNPEDKRDFQTIRSFSDRIQYINIPYVLDLKTEVEIYRSIFGKHIDESFLPGVLMNFARVIVSSRLNTKTETLLEWISDPKKYHLYCDETLQLLKMALYMGEIPTWLNEKDRKKFTAQIRRKIIAESEAEGQQGFSGRDSIKIFNEFYSSYAKNDKLINMGNLFNFFTKTRRELMKQLPDGFLVSLLDMYDYMVLQQVKESLYYYNEEQISRDIQNYLFALNFDIDSVETCQYTNERIEITEDFLEAIENHLLSAPIEKAQRLEFRKETQKEYISKTVSKEIMIEVKSIQETQLYDSLHERYINNLKEKVLDPLLKNENFRRAIKDYDEDDFKTYDKRIRNDVTFLINNLCNNYEYTAQGAKEVCIYAIDSELVKKFEDA